MHQSLVLPGPVRLREWQPELPPGDLRSISLHWTAGDYTSVYPAYHFCLRGSTNVDVVATNDLRANMRDLRHGPSEPYAMHTAGRNSWSIGLAVCAMAQAVPNDFARFPLTEEQVDGLCVVARRLADAYDIPLVAIRTHAEAALDDGYFGEREGERWDIARLTPSSERLTPEDARATGELLRARVAAVR